MNNDLYMYSESDVPDRILKLSGLPLVKFFRAITSVVSLGAIMLGMAVSAPLKRKHRQGD